MNYAYQWHREVITIRNPAPIPIILYPPKTKEDEQKLAQRVADIHAAAVMQRLNALPCTARQKLDLLNTILETVRQRNREQTE